MRLRSLWYVLVLSLLLAGMTLSPAAAAPSAPPVLPDAEKTVGPLSSIAQSQGTVLTLLHNNDGESSLLPITYSVDPDGYPITETVSLEIGSVAAFKTVVDNQIAQAHDAGQSVVTVYAGDAFLASASLICSFPVTSTEPLYDAVAQQQIPYDAHILGNHEFDYGPTFLRRFITSFQEMGNYTQPFLSANLDFSAEPALSDLVDPDGLILEEPENNQPLARSAIITVEVTSEVFGVVGATTPALPTITSPGEVTVTPTITETAVAVQAEIDRMVNDYGVNKIIFVSHLQDVNNDEELIAMLEGVDVAVAGGGDELLVSPLISETIQLLPGETQAIAGPYPLTVTDAAGRTVYVVTTAGNYKYLGRIDVEFDELGEVTTVITETTYPRRVIPESDVATTLGLTDTVPMDPGIVATVNEPLELCLEGLAEPIVQTEVVLDVSRGGSRSRETNAGNLITDAFVWVYEQYAEANNLEPITTTNPVVAVTNGGGIRQNAGNELPVGGVVTGTISRLDTLNVLPFDNYVTVVTDVTPSDLKTIFERSVANQPNEGGQFLQVSGLIVTANISAPVGSRVQEIRLAADGTYLVQDGAPVAEAPSVSVVTNSFTARGGDDYPTFAANPNKLNLVDDAGGTLTYEEAWVRYMLSFPEVEGLPTITADMQAYQPGGEGRIRLIAEPVADLLWYFPLIYNFYVVNGVDR